MGVVKQWEYKVFVSSDILYDVLSRTCPRKFGESFFPDDVQLNKMGLEGWELCGIAKSVSKSDSLSKYDVYKFYFKREK